MAEKNDVRTDESGRKQRRFRSLRLCAATGLTTHLADPRHRSPYCAQHFPEYEAHRRRYNDMLYNERHGRSSKQAPAPGEYWASVSWSPIDISPLLIISPDVASAIEERLSRLLRARGTFLRNPTGTEMPEDVRLPDLIRSIDSLWGILNLAGLGVKHDDVRIRPQPLSVHR